MEHGNTAVASVAEHIRRDARWVPPGLGASRVSRMTSWFAGSSAGKFFGLGAGGVLSSYVAYTRSETHRERPPESRAARKARGREAAQRTPAMFGRAVAVSPASAIMEGVTNSTALPLPADGAATETEEMTVTRRSVQVLASEDETPTSSSTSEPPRSAIRRKHEGRYSHRGGDDRARGGKFASFGHTAASIAAPFILSALKDLLSRRWRRLRRKDADVRRMERLRELLLALENSGHALAVPIAEELERLVTERDDALKELEERKRRRRRSPFGGDAREAADQPAQKSSPIDLAVDVSLRTRAAVARVRDLLTPQGKGKKKRPSLFSPGATPAKGAANLDSANASPENDQALLTTMGGSSDAKAVADLDRTVGFQARELRYLRMTLKEKERKIGNLTKRLKAAVDESGSLEADSAGSSPASDDAPNLDGLDWNVVAPRIVGFPRTGIPPETPGADSDDELSRQMRRMRRRPNFALVTPAPNMAGKNSEEARLRRAKSRVGRISPTGKRVAWVAVDSP